MQCKQTHFTWKCLIKLFALKQHRIHYKSIAIMSSLILFHSFLDPSYILLIGNYVILFCVYLGIYIPVRKLVSRLSCLLPFPGSFQAVISQAVSSQAIFIVLYLLVSLESRDIFKKLGRFERWKVLNIIQLCEKWLLV